MWHERCKFTPPRDRRPATESLLAYFCVGPKFFFFVFFLKNRHTYLKLLFFPFFLKEFERTYLNWRSRSCCTAVTILERFLKIYYATQTLRVYTATRPEIRDAHI
jgi:hypothetical protein